MRVLRGIFCCLDPDPDPDPAPVLDADPAAQQVQSAAKDAAHELSIALLRTIAHAYNVQLPALTTISASLMGGIFKELERVATLRPCVR